MVGPPARHLPRPAARWARGHDHRHRAVPQPRRPAPRSHAGAAAAGAGKRLSHQSAEGERPMSLGTPPPATAPRGGHHRLALPGLLVGIEIGRASWWERVGRSWLISVVAVSFKTKIII